MLWSCSWLAWPRGLGYRLLGRGLGYLRRIKHQVVSCNILREKIASHPDVVALFYTYKLEDGSGVKLDRNTASNHVKCCINEMKKTGVTRPNLTLVKVVNGVHTLRIV